MNLTSSRRVSGATLLTGLLLAFMGLFVFYPIAMVFGGALTDHTAGHSTLTLKHFVTFFTTSYLMRAMAHSFVVSLGAMVLAVSLAFVFAFTVHRTQLPGRKLFSAFALLPLVSPPIVLSMAMLLLFGKHGLFTPALHAAFGFTDLYGPVGIILAMGLTYLPHAYLLLEAALSRQDVPIEEAAQSLGARFWTLLRRVTLPMTAPALIRACLMVFILGMTDFGNPMMIGGDYKVGAVYLFDLIYRSVDDVPVSAAMGAVIVVPCLAAWLVAQKLARATRLTGGGKGGQRGEGSARVPFGAKLLFGGLCALTSSLVAALYATIGLGAVVKAVGADYTPTWRNFNPGTPDSGWTLVLMTIHLALMAAVIGAPLSIAIAWLTERVRPRGSALLAGLAMAPAALPGVIFGLGYLIAFHQAPLALTNTPWILVICLLTANLYVGVLAGATALQKIDPVEEEAARALGARGSAAFMRVVLPQLSTALINAFFFIFVRGMISLSAVVFLVGARYNVISVAILNRGEAGDFGIACAMAVEVLAVVLAAQGLLRLLESALRPFQMPVGLAAKVARAARFVSPFAGEPGSIGRGARVALWGIAPLILLAGLARPEHDVLNVIGAYDDDEFFAYLEGFQKAHPEIELHGRRLSSGQLVTRLVFEKDHEGFDVVFGLIDIYMEQLKKAGILEPYTPPEARNIPMKYRDPQGFYFHQDVLLIALGVNTKVLGEKGLPVPRTWEEVADPKYKGLVAVASPAASGTALTIFSRLADMFQPDPWKYVDRLDRNVFQYTSSGSAPGKMAAQGEAGIGITFDFPLYKRRKEGFPLEIVYPDRIPYTVEGSALLRGAKHEAVARTFLDWAASPEAMALYEKRKPLVTHAKVGPSEAWKKDIPLDRMYEMRAPFDPDRLVEAWAKRYAR